MIDQKIVERMAKDETYVSLRKVLDIAEKRKFELFKLYIIEYFYIETLKRLFFEKPAKTKHMVKDLILYHNNLDCLTISDLFKNDKNENEVK